ncbi:MAG: Rieske 2Fe-2S domain-containing protein [Deltaproteobacteria bacterium]|nr:Rieske 2Fe-2S domain-containing protein [Deltaproteobacteria bacterium]
MPENALRWVSVPVAPPEPGRTALLELEGRRLVLCNAEGALYVVDDRCPHAGAELSKGRLRGCVLECPFHGGKLDVRSGAPVTPPIRHAAATYAVRVDDTGLAIALPGA